MERLNWHMANELAKVAELRAVGPEGASELAPAGVTVEEVPLKPLARFLLAALWRALRLVRQWQPDLVLAGSGLTFPLAWLAARAGGGLTAVYLHGLDITAPSYIYQKLWLPVIRRADRVIVNSHATEQLAIEAGISASRISVIHPGVMLPETALGQDLLAKFRKRHDLGDGPILLSVGRLTRRKGLVEFVHDVLPLVLKWHPGAQLVIVGTAPDAALQAEAVSKDEILAPAEQLGIQNHIRFLGKLPEEELQTAYAAADVCVFPVQSRRDNPEGFGMVAVEAAAQGLSTVAYASGGVVDAIKDGVSGRLVEPGNTEQFADAINGFLMEPADPERLRAFAEQFAWGRFGESLFNRLERTVSRHV